MTTKYLRLFFNHAASQKNEITNIIIRSMQYTDNTIIVNKSKNNSFVLRQNLMHYFNFHIGYKK